VIVTLLRVFAFIALGMGIFLEYQGCNPGLSVGVTIAFGLFVVSEIRSSGDKISKGLEDIKEILMKRR